MCPKVSDTAPTVIADACRTPKYVENGHWEMHWNDNGPNFICKPTFLTFLVQTNDKTRERLNSNKECINNIFAGDKYFLLRIVFNFPRYFDNCPSEIYGRCFQVVMCYVIKIASSGDQPSANNFDKIIFRSLIKMF